MWKSTAKTLFIALSMTTLGTGCSIQDLVDFLNSIQPPPPPVEDCGTLLEECLADGTDPDACIERYQECEGVVPPPIDDCEQQLNECLDQYGYDEPVYFGDAYLPPENDCWFQYDECMGYEPPPPPPVDDCEIALDECLNGYYPEDDGTGMAPLWDPNTDDCWVQYDECMGYEPPPPPPTDVCEQELDDCLAQFQSDEEPYMTDYYDPSMDVCWENYDACIGSEPPPPPPIDPCEEIFMDCLQANDGDPSSCEQDFELCLDGRDEPYAP